MQDPTEGGSQKEAQGDEARPMDVASSSGSHEEEPEKEEARGDGPTEECQICSDEFPEGQLFHLSGCNHKFCKGCWEQYLATEFDEKRKSFLDIPCPGFKCTKKLTEDDYRKLMSAKSLVNYEAVWKTIPERATCFQDFNYGYDDKGILRNLVNGDKFHWVNQAHYDALGDYIIDYIQDRMKSEFGLQEVLLPLGVNDPSVPRNNIFLSPNALTADKLVLLIQGSGAVRPGQWARALCINDSLEMGTILPYLKLIQDRGWGVIVFNPNQNVSYPPPGADEPDLKCRKAFLNTQKVMRPLKNAIRIPGNETPTKHCLYVWDHFGVKAAATDVCIVAHSAGGACTMDILREREDELLGKVRGVAFTDSVHWVSPRDPPAVKRFIKANAINWVKSDDPLDTPIRTSDSGCPCVSAGHSKHEWTSGCAITSVFKFLDQKFGVAAPPADSSSSSPSSSSSSGSGSDSKDHATAGL